MGILDNLEAYMELEDKCHYCQNKAKYTAVSEAPYEVIGVCQCHFVQDIS
jgi:hypothetical protein